MIKINLLILIIISSFQSWSLQGLTIQTIDYSFQDKWHRTVSSSTPKISIAEHVFKKQYFYVTAIASDFALDAEGRANVTYSIFITSPNGSSYAEQKDLPLIQGMVTNKTNLQMSNNVLKICFEENDEFGKYVIGIEIIDHVSGEQKKLQSNLKLVELPSYKDTKVKNDADFSTWISTYYQHQKPEEALSYYLYYAKSKLSDNESSFWPVFSIFMEIAKNNAYLLPQITECYVKQDLKTKIYLLYLLRYSGIGTADFYEQLEGDEKKTYLKLKDSPDKDFYGEITDPAQLDMLWGTFTASGSYEPILKLIQTLDYEKYQGALDNFKKSKQTEEDRNLALKNAIYNALVWSMKSNARQHELVKAYLVWALNNETLSEIQKTELKNLMFSKNSGEK